MPKFWKNMISTLEQEYPVFLSFWCHFTGVLQEFLFHLIFTTTNLSHNDTFARQTFLLSVEAPHSRIQQFCFICHLVKLHTLKYALLKCWIHFWTHCR